MVLKTFKSKLLSVALASLVSLVAIPATGLAQENIVEPPAGPKSLEQFQIGVFWPPVSTFMNEQQYDYLKEAHINWIQNVDTTDLDTVEKNKRMLELANARGIKVSVADSRFHDLDKATDSDIGGIVNDYTGTPGLGGYYIKDEPGAPHLFAHAYKKFLELDPASTPYINLLPTYGPVQPYRDYVEELVDSVGAANLKYLFFDNYPFTYNSTAGDHYYNNLEIIRQVGLQSGVKTGAYLQTAGESPEAGGVMRRPTINEARYNLYTTLAYGMKAIQYFTWWTPENTTGSIILRNGEKSDLYEIVKENNRQVSQLGPTLMKLDAVAVYHSGSAPLGNAPVPDTFFWKPQNGSDDVIISHMVDRYSGRNYIMVVNKSFTETKTLSFNVDPNISKISKISKVNGREVGSYAKKGVVTDEFLPGEGKLFALPEDYANAMTQPEPAPGTNLALNKKVSASSSSARVGQGWFVSRAVDGKRWSEDGSMGWSSESAMGAGEGGPESITVDLGRSLSLNRVDLYPAGRSYGYGLQFPMRFSIRISNDNVSWTEVVREEGYSVPRDTIPSFKFADSRARYIKIEGTELNQFAGTMELGEIEVYNDDGSMGPPPAPEELPPIDSPGANLALNKPVSVSSSLDLWGWSKNAAVDGNRLSLPTAMGWTSNGELNQNHTEWIKIYLGAEYDVSKVDLYPKNGNGSNPGEHFPIDFTIQTSMNGVDWTTEASVTDYPNPGGTKQSFEFAAVKAKYVKVEATKLQAVGTDYRAQFAEIEVYGSGTPPIDSPGTNLALNRPVTASSSLDIWGWSKDSAVDGNRLSLPTAMGWTSNGELNQNHTEWIKIDLDAEYDISKVDLYPKNGNGSNPGEHFPIDFTIQTSMNGVDWTTEASVTDYPNPGGTKQSFEFAPVKAKYVKVEATKLQAVGTDDYRAQLAEIEVYGPAQK